MDTLGFALASMLDEEPGGLTWEDAQSSSGASHVFIDRSAARVRAVCRLYPYGQKIKSLKAKATTNQILGSLYGGALGDAFASAAEGREVPLSSYEPTWTLTDDTQLTLSTCRAIVASGGVSPEGIARQLREDFERGHYTGLGATTLGALRALSTGAHWALAGIQGERAAGNGAAMRCAPVAFLLELDDWTDRQTFRDVARITHRNEEALAGAQVLAVSVQCMLTHPRPSAHELLSHAIAGTFDSRIRDNLCGLRDAGDFDYARAAQQLGTGGFAAHSVPLALLAALFGVDAGVESMFEAIVEVGGDTDSIASMAGQLVGAAIGFDGLPAGLLGQLPERDVLDEVFGSFGEFVVGVV